jgi:FtsP/CotA-like multicopper oxidase with cupredoxin domain
MHSHHGLQEQLLMAAPLIIRSEEDLRADAQDVVVLLHDFTFRDPSEVLADLTGRAVNMQHGMSMPQPHAGIMSGPGMGMGGMHMGDHPMPMPAGGAMDLNDVDYDAYLANDRTLSDPLVVRTERSARVRLRLINGATTTAFWIDLGTLQGAVTAVDGNPVRPVTGQRFPIAQGQRLDILMQLPRDGGAFPVLAQREGDRQRTGIILASPGRSIVKVSSLADRPTLPVDLSLERRLASLSPLQIRQPSITHRTILTGTMKPYTWSINGHTWGDHQRLRVSKGQRVVLEMVNQSMMAHPMHLHGHHFQVIALNGHSLIGAVRDTVLVPVHGSVTVVFDADNPGRWLLHCHNLFHMATGMMTEVAYDNVT